MSTVVDIADRDILTARAHALTFFLTVNAPVSAVDASIPGFKLSPLHNLTVTSPWASDPVPFEHNKHSKQQGEDVTILPFEMAPIKTLAKIAALPRTTVAKHGIGLGELAHRRGPSVDLVGLTLDLAFASQIPPRSRLCSSLRILCTCLRTSASLSSMTGV